MTEAIEAIDHRTCDGRCFVDDHNQSEEFKSKKLNEFREKFDEHKGKLLWTRIPKTASTSVSKYLGLEGWPHHSIKLCQELLSPEEYENAYKFTFLRNPFERLTSIYEFYRYHNQDGFRTGTICIQDFPSWVLRGCPHNIRVNHPLDEHEDLRDRKYLLQTAWMVDAAGNIDYDFIGVVDNIDEHTKFLKQALVDRGIIDDIQYTQSNIEGKPDSVPYVNVGAVSVERNGKTERVLKEPGLWRRYYDNNEVFETAKYLLREDITVLGKLGYGVCV